MIERALKFRPRLNLFVAALALLVGAAAAHADLGVIELNPTAKVAAGDPALLGDVATLSGEPALALASTVLRKSGIGTDVMEITTGDIRTALTARNANWGRLTLRGSVCEVRVGDAARRQAAPKMKVDAAPTTVDLTGPMTVRTRLAALVGRMFDVENEDLRVRFDERDSLLLNRPIGDGARVEIQPASSASSSRMAFVIWVYEGESLEPTSETIRVDVQVRRPVVIVKGDIRRGDAISAGDVSVETRWMAPVGAAPMTDAEQAVGMRARRKIVSGSVIRVDSVEPPIACERGDLVKVHCVSGGVVVKAWARAQAKARDGEMVELLMTGSEKSFQARMTGRGVAVMNLAG